MIKNNSIFNKKYAKFSTKWWVLPNFNNLTCAYNHHYDLHQKLVLYFSQFSPPHPTLTYSQNYPYKPHWQYLSLYLSNFSPPYFCAQQFRQLAPEIFSLPQPFSQLGLRHKDQRARESCDDQNRLVLSFLPQNMESDNGAHIHWYLIAQSQKIGVL